APPAAPPRAEGGRLLLRIDDAAEAAGIARRLDALDPPVREALAASLDAEAGALAADLRAARPETLEGRTVVIEFARGGPRGATMPLSPPLGYAYSLGMLSPAILERAVVLYVWVTPEESRRRNRERADPDDPGSILHHGVPEEVMLADYGCDDMEWLIGRSDRPGMMRVEAHGRSYRLPVARFDNRVDRTSFVRCDPSMWTAAEVESLHGALAEALAGLAAAER
ncbi:MAG: hypothetical protein QME96_05715, partial [Myxococcota bacterium]|nr:hypothetical protein [Myxococcota bacterium]